MEFINECKRRDLWYNRELKLLMAKHDMLDLYETKIKPVDMHRWYPEEVFSVLGLNYE